MTEPEQWMRAQFVKVHVLSRSNFEVANGRAPGASRVVAIGGVHGSFRRSEEAAGSKAPLIF